ncbi:alpha/beta hydrolase [Ruicaihuangia caeni]|uniref:Alpha/beta hydrolase n=1 Tax=Ruicaihuangia caeni TaxID=3042517 RepID=A0AAW6T3T8_9MICO|nr:alpha/beta hydrolase [Klugiella sp. YN-L-19]MDI2097741.1 alpha/beta hydrolase [Klugiella sp. YN-L-19]
MLLAALLLTSTAITPVEVAAMPAERPAAASELLDSTQARELPRAAPERKQQALDAEWMLDAAASAPPADLAKRLAADPRLVDRLLIAPPPAVAVAAWWEGLTAGSRAVLLAGAPHVVGNLDGIPYAARDLANHVALERSVERLQRELTAAGRSARAGIQQRLDALSAVERALGEPNANPRRSLIALQIPDEGEPTAAIALGDLDRADFVSYLVPGMFFGVRTQLVQWTDTAARLYDEQRSWLRVLAEADTNAGRQDVATIAWIGYQTPDLLNVGALDLAREGSAALSRSILGLQTVRADREPHVSVLAHSYGSTAALMALSNGECAVDALALVGSPGGEAASVEDLAVARGNVFVGEAVWDPIPNSSFFGADPGASGFGARVMSVAGGIDAITNEKLDPSSGHNAYFEPGTESLRNLALIGIGRGGLVTDGTPQDAMRTLALVREGRA